MLKLLSLGGALLLLAGCGTVTGPNQQYDAPAVSGRVVDAVTGQPIKSVRVSRLTTRPEAMDPFLKTAGQQMIADTPVRTGADGTFYLKALRSAYLIFSPSSSLSLTLSAEHSRYQTLITNLDLVKIKADKTDRGPEVKTGELRLQPKAP